MHRPLFLVAAGSVAAVGGLLVASAMPAGAATAVRAETMAVALYAPVTSAVYRDALSPRDCADTPVTFTVTSTGVLAITAPTTPSTSVRPAVAATPARPSAPPPTSALSRLPTTAPLTLLPGPRRSPQPTSEHNDRGFSRHHPRQRCHLYSSPPPAARDITDAYGTASGTVLGLPGTVDDHAAAGRRLGQRHCCHGRRPPLSGTAADRRHGNRLRR